VQVAYEDMVDLRESDTVFPKLQLCPFSAVDQKKPLMCTEHMSGRISF
jgi:hypothetical protein